MKLRAFERYKKLRTYLLNNESGDVTIDWVGITAVIAGLRMATTYTLSPTRPIPSSSISAEKRSRQPSNTPCCCHDWRALRVKMALQCGPSPQLARSPL